MKKRWLGYLAWGLLSYAAFLVATLPAGWLAWGVNTASRGVVSIDRSQGSLWRGSGQLTVNYPGATPRDFGYAEWRVYPWSLVFARLRVSLAATGPQSTISALLTLSPREATLADSRASVSASFARLFYAPAGLLSPSGRLRASVTHLKLNRSGLFGTAQLFWDDAGSDLVGVNPLGNYRLDVRGEGENVRLELLTVRGALELAGQGSWRPLKDGMLQLSGFARARSRQEELRPLLQLLGREQGGRWTFELRTRVRLRELLPR